MIFKKKLIVEKKSSVTLPESKREIALRKRLEHLQRVIDQQNDQKAVYRKKLREFRAFIEYCGLKQMYSEYLADRELLNID